MTQQRLETGKSDRFTLERLYADLSTTVADLEKKLDEATKKLKDEGGDPSQADVLRLQAQINAWSNLITLISGLLRAVGDALKSASQNIR